MSRQLTDEDPLPPGGLTCWAGGTKYAFASAIASGDSVYGIGGYADGFVPSASVCHYDGSTPLLADDLGRPVQAWSGYGWTPA